MGDLVCEYKYLKYKAKYLRLLEGGFLEKAKELTAKATKSVSDELKIQADNAAKKAKEYKEKADKIAAKAKKVAVKIGKDALEVGQRVGQQALAVGQRVGQQALAVGQQVGQQALAVGQQIGQQAQLAVLDNVALGGSRAQRKLVKFR